MRGEKGGHLDRLLIQLNAMMISLLTVPGLKRRELHHWIFHGCLAATRHEIHPEICYTLVEGVPGN